jgi:hypothetical protein
MNQNSVSKKAGERWSVIRLAPSAASSALASASNSMRSCIENPIEATGTLARRLSTSRAIACGGGRSLKASVSSNTERPASVSDGIDLNNSHVHS